MSRALPANPPLNVAPLASAASTLSRFVAGGLLLAGLFFTEAVFEVHDVESVKLNWQILMRLGLCGLCGLFGAWKLPTTFRVLDRFPGAWITLLGMWALITVPFSANVNYALAAVAALWCMILFVPAALMELGGKRALQISLASSLCFLAASWFVYFKYPELGQTEFISSHTDRVYRLGGLSDANGLGRIAALVICLSMILYWERALGLVVAGGSILFAAVTLAATDSRTSMAMAAAAAALVAWRYLRHVALSWALFGGLAGSLALVAMLSVNGGGALSGVLGRLSRSGDQKELSNLTGRTYLWSFAWKAIEASPVAGHGFGCSRFVMKESPEFPTGHAHNVLLNVMLGSGVVGVGCMLGMLIQLTLLMSRSPSVFADVMTVFLWVGGIAESMIFGPVPSTFTILWLMAVCWRAALPQDSWGGSRAAEPMETHS